MRVTSHNVPATNTAKLAMALVRLGEAGEVLVAETPLDDLLVQNRALLHAWQSGEKCDYDLASVLPTMEVLERAQRSAAHAQR